MIDLDKELNYLIEKCSTNSDSDLWSSRVRAWISRVVNAEGKLDREALANFRRLQVFVNELPRRELFPIGWTNGFHRGSWRYMKERLRILEGDGDIELLRKYPISEVGNPITANVGGCRFNKRWINNIRYLALMKRHMRDYLESDCATFLDIGGAYGALLYLLRKEFPKVRSAIVEFPEQLLLTHYFLQQNWPDAKINSLRAAYDVDRIDGSFVDEFDFVLIPVECYDKIQAGTFGAVSNFFSLGEMSENWFFRYIRGGGLTGAKYFTTVNRVQSFPSYDTNLTLLNYGLDEYEALHFQVSEHEKYYYNRRMRFFITKEYYSSPSFEFVGRRSV